MRICQIKKYEKAKYPMAIFVPPKPGVLGKTLGLGFSALLAGLIIESCDGIIGGTRTMGVPDTRMLTEHDARVIIKQAFLDNNINLAEDVDLVFKSDTLSLDGYNDSLNVGYEYIFGTDYDEFNNSVRGSLDSASDQNGPFIKCIDTYHEDRNNINHLRMVIQQFIDTLKANGAI